MIVDILLKSLMKVALTNDITKADEFFDAESVIRENRTVTLGLPRQVGKTEALVRLYHAAPCILVTRDSPMRRHLEDRGVQAHTLDELRHMAMGKRIEVQEPLHYMLLDECISVEGESRKHIFDVAADLWRRGQVDKSRFVVINIGT